MNTCRGARWPHGTAYVGIFDNFISIFILIGGTDLTVGFVCPLWKFDYI